MITLDTDYLSLEFREQDVIIPVDAKDESKGCVTVRLREIPFAIKKSIDLKFYAANERLQRASASLSKMGKGEEVLNSEIDDIGQAFGTLRESQLEIIRWAVCGHNADDFLVKGVPFPFESTETILAGVRYSVVGPRVLRLYQLVSSQGIDAVNTNLIANMASSARAFQNGTIPTPEEVWNDYRS
jgi:hypothetical protein